jgi:hypothetical protein
VCVLLTFTITTGLFFYTVLLLIGLKGKIAIALSTMSLRGFIDFPLRPSGEPDPPASGRPSSRLGKHHTAIQ